MNIGFDLKYTETVPVLAILSSLQTPTSQGHTKRFKRPTVLKYII